MLILVTGSSGLVGSSLVKELSGGRYSVTGISSKEVNLMDRDITHKYILNLMPDIIINCAARVGGIGGSSLFPVEFLSDNIQIQTNLMDGAHRAGVRKFIFLGCSCIYPTSSDIPIKEESLLSGNLELTNSAFSIAKIAGIELIKAYRNQYGYSWISLISSNLYGPNDNFDLTSSHVIPALIRKFVVAKESGLSEVVLWGSGSPLRDFLYVDDFAKAVKICIENYDSEMHINVGSGLEISIKDLADLIAKVVGFSGLIRWDIGMPQGVKRKLLNNDKIYRTGWKPTTSLEQGIELTVEWYQSNK